MTDLHQITPFLHVPDLDAALHRLTRVLRFEVKYQVPGYAYLEWDGVGLRVLEEPGRALPGPGQARMTVYLDVPEVDGLYARLRPGLATLPAEDVMPPRNQPWGQREFHLRMPDGHWLAVGMPVAEGAKVDQGPSMPF
jgi:uncharacterized glyoxalase superfamily protein PhnB